MSYVINCIFALASLYSKRIASISSGSHYDWVTWSHTCIRSLMLQLIIHVTVNDVMIINVTVSIHQRPMWLINDTICNIVLKPLFIIGFT